MSDTASIARSVISEAAESTNAAPSTESTKQATAVADGNPWLEDEVRHYMADDKDNPTRRWAAIATSMLDKRPFRSTRYADVRREFADDGNQTRRIAREALDAQTHFSDVDPKQLAKDRRALDIERFAADVNRSTGQNTLAGDDIIGQVIAKGRANR